MRRFELLFILFQVTPKFQRFLLKNIKNHMMRSCMTKLEFLPELNMFGYGRNSHFIIQDLIMWNFYVFQKKSLEFSITWTKINSSSDLLISYPSITQTQIKHILSMSFKFRAISYVKSISSKTQENSRLKTRYLKGITKEHYSSFPSWEIIFMFYLFIDS